MPARSRNTRRFLAAALVAVAVLAALVVVLLVRGQNPAQRMARLWAREGVGKPNVILITLDTTRADRLGCYGYARAQTPNLDRLAERGIVFEQCSTSSPLTLPAHCTIMTGMYPTYHGVRVNGNTALSEVQTTLAEAFSGQGYECGAFIAAFVLDGRWGLKQGFSHYDDDFDLRKYKQIDLGMVQRPGSEIMDSALSWLDGRKDRPFFAWIHLYDPHAPYEPPEPYFSKHNTGPAGLYDGEIAFTDEQVGRCVSWLAQNGLDRNTVLVIVGDHGEALGSHGEPTHGYYIYDYAVRVPLLVVLPFDEVQGRRVASQVSTVDLSSTLLELARLGAQEQSQGRSLLPQIFGQTPSDGEAYAYSESMAPNIQFGWAPLHGLRTGRYKFIDAPRLELYDLDADPDEQVNILDDRPSVARGLKAELERLMAETSQGAPSPQAADLDRDTLERLAALGYVGTPVAPKKAAGRGQFLADPKDKLQVFAAIQRAGEQIMQEQYGPAARDLEWALREEPGIPQALLLLSTCYVELGRAEEAKAQLNALLKDDPLSVQALISMAKILQQEGRRDDVIALCKRTLSIDGRNPQAFTIMGEVYIAKQDHEKALPNLEKAVEIQPKLTRNRLNLAVCLVGLKRYDRAEAMLKGIIAEFSKFPLAYYHLGLLYEELGRTDEARKAYAQEVALYPEHFRARFNLGRLLLKSGELSGYIREMRDVVRLSPDAAEGHLFLARGLLHEASDLEEVQRLVERGLSLAKTSELKALGYFLLADVYTRKNQPAKVQEALKKANDFKNQRGE